MREFLQFGVGYRSPYVDQEEFDSLTTTPEEMESEFEHLNDWLDAGLADMEIVSAPLGWQN